MNKNTKQSESEIFSFPCSFPIKIMGLNKPQLEKLIIKTFHDHLSEKDQKTMEINKNVSKHENYLSITVTFQATSKKQLDDIYKDLSKHCGKEDDKIIKMIL